MKKNLTFLFCLMCYSTTEAFPERYYQDKYCEGITEYVLPDRTRVDCLTTQHAIEYDFSNKWAESIGQSLYYSMMTGKKAGIVLIIRSTAGEKHWQKLNHIIEHYSLSIDTWMIKTKLFK